MTAHTGTCHCGNVEFQADIDLSQTFTCNCSFCIRRGAVLARIQASDFELKSNEDHLGIYGKRDFSKHYFCKTCGIHCFTRISRDGKESVAVNLGCLDGVDITTLTPQVFDGATLL